MFVKRIVITLVVILAGIFGLSACENPDAPSAGVEAEAESGESNHNKLVEQQPAENMEYSATRETINFFTETWGVKGKVAYVYLMNNEGKVIGYYVTQGAPVSMCTAIRPTYDIVRPDIPGDNTAVLSVPAPGSDGAYYSGGECNTYYAKDAMTGAYIQYTAGTGINPLLYDQPLSPGIVGDAPNLGDVQN